MPGSRPRVAAGFKVVYGGLVIVVMAVVAIVVAFLNVQFRGPQAVSGILLMAGLLVAPVGTIIGLVGRFLCLSVPKQAGNARRMISVSVALSLTALLVSSVSIADLFADFLPAEVKIVAMSGTPVLEIEILAAGFFLLCTRAIAEYIERRDLRVWATSVLRLWLATLVVLGAGIVVVLLAGMGGGGSTIDAKLIGIIVMVLALILGVVNLFRYAFLLIAMSSAILKHGRGDNGRSKYRGRDRYQEEEEEEDEDEEDDRRRRRRRRRREDDDPDLD
jgi:hypothetical protein